MLCYIPFVGGIMSIVVLASARFQQDRPVRFHAFQGLYLLVAWLLVDWVVRPFLRALPGPSPMEAVGWLLNLVILGTWIFMIVKTSQELLQPSAFGDDVLIELANDREPRFTDSGVDSSRRAA